MFLLQEKQQILLARGDKANSEFLLYYQSSNFLGTNGYMNLKHNVFVNGQASESEIRFPLPGDNLFDITFLPGIGKVGCSIVFVVVLVVFVVVVVVLVVVVVDVVVDVDV